MFIVKKIVNNHEYYLTLFNGEFIWTLHKQLAHKFMYESNAQATAAYHNGVIERLES